MAIREEVRELMSSFARHRDAIQEKLKQQPDDDVLRDRLEDATAALEALAIAAEATLPGVPEKDLEENFRSLIDELVEEETSMAQALGS